MRRAVLGRRPGEASGRMIVTVVDQILSSVSNFVTGVAVARFSGAAQFGEYMLVVLMWLVVIGVHRRLIAEPVIVVSGNADTTGDVLARGLTLELLLGAVASSIVAAVGLLVSGLGSHLGVTMLAFSPWFVPLLVQDYWRAMAFQRRRPDLALRNDALFAGVQLACIGMFAALGWRTAAHMIAAWGIGATAGAILGYRWFPSITGARDGWRMFRDLWPMSRWLFADFLTAFASQQAYIAFAAVLLTSVEYGGFRAAASLMGPAMVILLAAGNFGLPEASRRADASDRSALNAYVRRLSWATVLCLTLYAVALAVAADRLLGLLYGDEFTGFATLAVLVAVQYVLMVTAYGQGIALKATGTIRKLWPIRIGIAVVSIPVLWMFVHAFGVNGTGWSAVFAGACDAAAVFYVYRRHAPEDRAEVLRHSTVLAGSAPVAEVLDVGGT